MMPRNYRSWMFGLVFAAGAIWFIQPRIAQAAPCGPESIRWASSTNTLYIHGAGAVCTLSELDALAPKATITLIDPAGKVWLIGTNIWLQNGARLTLHGSSVGGDVNELRLKSDSVRVFLRAYWGTIDINSTTITSWDETRGGPDGNYSDGRSYIQAKSFLEGSTPRESRMNIANSDIGYLGYNAAESYGLSWKVLGQGPSVYEAVNVYGDITNSTIHHNYFGAYAYGAFGMNIKNNEFANNISYGLDPHDDSDNLIIEDNTVHHNGTHGIICSQRCNDIQIRRNKSFDNGGHGIMIHRLVTNSVVEDNEAYNNVDAGIPIFESHNNTIQRNKVYNNGKGIRLSVGSSGNLIRDNQVTNNREYGLYFYKGSDAPTSGDGRPKNNQFINNTITGSGIYGIKMSDSDTNVFRGNRFISNGQMLLLESSAGNRFESNTISNNAAAGLTLKSSPNTVMTGNTIDRNGAIGVDVASASNNTRITGNTISNHRSFGIRVKGATGVVTSPNTFSNNGKNVGS